MRVILLLVLTNLPKVPSNVGLQSYRKSGMLNRFLVTNFQLKVELMYSLHMHRRDNIVTKVTEKGVVHPK